MMHDPPGTRSSNSRGDTSAPASAPGDRVVLVAGRVLSDRYEVRQRIGAGGMGAVYVAHDRVRNQEIAIKVLLPGLLDDPQARRRFFAEGRLASQLSHAGIVDVLEVGQDGPLYLLTMELLKGRTLRQEMEARSQSRELFEITEVRRIGAALCEALAYAHEHIVHHAVRPENVFLTPDHQVKLMDFGITRFLDSSQLKTMGTAMGTSYYMAPEQLKDSTKVDHRADQYSVAVVLYEMLTGKVPAWVAQPAASARSDVPRSLSDALLRALSDQAEGRFPNMNAFAKALATGGAESRPLYRRIPLIAAVALVVLGIVAVGVVGLPRLRTSGGARTTAGSAPSGSVPEEKEKAAALEAKDVARGLMKQLEDDRQSLDSRLEDARRENRSDEVTILSDLKSDAESRVYRGAELTQIQEQLTAGDEMLAKEDYAKALPAFQEASRQLTALIAIAKQEESDARRAVSDDGASAAEQTSQVKDQRQAEAAQQAEEARKAAEAKAAAVVARTTIAVTAAEKSAVAEAASKGLRFASVNGVVIDTRTNLMWASRDNGADIGWAAAKSYGSSYSGGGYGDWNLATIEQLRDLAEVMRNCSGGSTGIQLTGCVPWSSESRDTWAAYVSMLNGRVYWFPQSFSVGNRALAVRSSK